MTYISDVADAVRGELSADQIPDGDTNRLFLLYAVLTLVKGQAVDERDVHNAWSAWMAREDPSHEAIVPYDELDRPTQQMDTPYVRAIRAVSVRLSGDGLD